VISEIGPQSTLYDHLVLSLRKKNYIATFNWDPLLLRAHRPNRQFTLPKVLSLHGNVDVGYCANDRTAGLVRTLCSKCHQPFSKRSHTTSMPPDSAVPKLAITGTRRSVQP
jgi:hypothetical protein